jgi:hypothetical protein
MIQTKQKCFLGILEQTALIVGQFLTIEKITPKSLTILNIQAKSQLQVAQSKIVTGFKSLWTKIGLKSSRQSWSMPKMAMRKSLMT